jgi:hypothetical protein
MSLPWWSVRLVNGAADRGLIPHAALGGELRSLELRLGEGDEPDTATFEIQAPDARNARLLAQHELGAMRKRAGVRDGPDDIIWVVPLADEPESSLRFRQYAEDGIADERYDLAVALIQIHLEVQVRVLVKMVAEAAPSALLDAVSRGQQRWAPHERWLQPILEALLSVRMADCPAWADYKGPHISRRNAVVHSGQPIDADSARASLETVSQLWLWLNDAAIVAVGAPRLPY